MVCWNIIWDILGTNILLKLNSCFFFYFFDMPIGTFKIRHSLDVAGLAVVCLTLDSAGLGSCHAFVPLIVTSRLGRLVALHTHTDSSRQLKQDLAPALTLSPFSWFQTPPLSLQLLSTPELRGLASETWWEVLKTDCWFTGEQGGGKVSQCSALIHPG